MVIKYLFNDLIGLTVYRAHAGKLVKKDIVNIAICFSDCLEVPLEYNGK